MPHKPNRFKKKQKSANVQHPGGQQEERPGPHPPDEPDDFFSKIFACLRDSAVVLIPAGDENPADGVPLFNMYAPERVDEELARTDLPRVGDPRKTGQQFTFRYESGGGQYMAKPTGETVNGRAMFTVLPVQLPQNFLNSLPPSVANCDCRKGPANRNMGFCGDCFTGLLPVLGNPIRVMEHMKLLNNAAAAAQQGATAPSRQGSSASAASTRHCEDGERNREQEAPNEAHPPTEDPKTNPAASVPKGSTASSSQGNSREQASGLQDKQERLNKACINYLSKILQREQQFQDGADRDRHREQASAPQSDQEIFKQACELFISKFGQRIQDHMPKQFQREQEAPNEVPPPTEDPKTNPATLVRNGSTACASEGNSREQVSGHPREQEIIKNCKLFSSKFGQRVQDHMPEQAQREQEAPNEAHPPTEDPKTNSAASVPKGSAASSSQGNSREQLEGLQDKQKRLNKEFINIRSKIQQREQQFQDGADGDRHREQASAPIPEQSQREQEAPNEVIPPTEGPPESDPFTMLIKRLKPSAVVLITKSDRNPTDGVPHFLMVEPKKVEEVLGKMEFNNPCRPGAPKFSDPRLLGKRFMFFCAENGRRHIARPTGMHVMGRPTFHTAPLELAPEVLAKTPNEVLQCPSRTTPGRQRKGNFCNHCYYILLRSFERDSAKVMTNLCILDAAAAVNKGSGPSASQGTSKASGLPQKRKQQKKASPIFVVDLKGVVHISNANGPDGLPIITVDKNQEEQKPPTGDRKVLPGLTPAEVEASLTKANSICACEPRRTGPGQCSLCDLGMNFARERADAFGRTQIEMEADKKDLREQKLATMEAIELDRYETHEKKMEKAFKSDCTTFTTVTKRFLSKDPTIGKQLHACLSKTIEDLTKKMYGKIDEYLGI